MSLIGALRKVGLEVESVSVAPLSVYNCVEFNEDLYSEATAVIDMGAKTTTLIVCDGEGLWSRNIPIGGENITQAISREMQIDMTQAEAIKKESYIAMEGIAPPPNASPENVKASQVIESVCKRLMMEVKRSIGFYRTQSKGRGISRVLVSGGGLKIGNLKDFLEKNLGVAVDRMFPLKKMSVSPQINRDELNNVTHLLSDCIGLGLRMLGKSKLSINLVPKIISYQKELAKKKVFIVGAVLLLIGTMIVLTMNTMKIRAANYDPQIEKFTAEKSRLEIPKNKIAQTRTKMLDLNKRLDNVRRLERARLYWVDFITVLKDKKPKAAWFIVIKVEAFRDRYHSAPPICTAPMLVAWAVTAVCLTAACPPGWDQAWEACQYPA